MEDELWNAGLEEREFLIGRIALCEEVLRRFASDDDLLTENCRRALGESYYELGEKVKADALFRDWLNADPRWGWGWIGWSGCYESSRPQPRDPARAEQILREGLSVAGVRDRRDILDRLARICEEQGREEESAELRLQADVAEVEIEETTLDMGSGGTGLRQTTKVTFGGEGLPLSEFSNLATLLRGTHAPAPLIGQRVGRNDPCPCGSGKKFKKCCGGG